MEEAVEKKAQEIIYGCFWMMLVVGCFIFALIHSFLLAEKRRNKLNYDGFPPPPSIRIIKVFFIPLSTLCTMKFSFNAACKVYKRSWMKKSLFFIFSVHCSLFTDVMGNLSLSHFTFLAYFKMILFVSVHLSICLSGR